MENNIVPFSTLFLHNLTTMQDISSVLFLATASSVNALAAAKGSLYFLAKSTASWLLTT
jgi:hypothetical protein